MQSITIYKSKVNPSPSYRSTNLRYKNNELGRYKKTRLTLDLYIMMKTLAGNIQNNHYGEGNLQNWMGGNGVKKKKKYCTIYNSDCQISHAIPMLDQLLCHALPVTMM